MTPRIGVLRRRLALEAPVDVPDGAGGVARSWNEIASVWAEVAPRRSSETVEDGRAVGLVTHRVTLRRRDDVERGVRFTDGEERYRVLTVVEGDAQRRFLDCLCEEEQP
ncbi:phage head closure protein [Acuticoccus sp.]|uniref:phage head closure protein n=1 Tax=Acuticoccus sp. TaxID=1904378 RepID=UPI003B51DA51